jgi:hypothetical protein
LLILRASKPVPKIVKCVAAEERFPDLVFTVGVCSTMIATVSSEEELVIEKPLAFLTIVDALRQPAFVTRNTLSNDTVRCVSETWLTVPLIDGTVSV